MRPSASASAAVGYDDNLSGATTPEERVGSGTASARGGVAASVGWRRVGARASVNYSGRAVFEVPQLTSHAGTLGLSGHYRASYALDFNVAPSVTARWVADEMRSGFDVGASAGLRLRASHGVAAVFAYGISYREAQEAVFGGTTHTARGGPELRLARRTYLSADYSLVLGPTVRYATVVDSTGLTAAREVPLDAKAGTRSENVPPKDAPTTPSAVFEPDQLAFRVSSTTHVAVIELEQGLTDQLYVGLLGGYAWVWAEQSLSTARFVQVTFGVRLP